MPKNKFQKLIFTIQETRQRLAADEISPQEAKLVFDRLLREYEEIKKSSESDDFQVFFNRIV